MGYANLQSYDTLRPDDIFQLASVSKTITSVAIMLLVQEGKLNLDDSVQNYIPNLPVKNLTIRFLLSHQSGLPDYFDFSDRLWPNKSKLIHDTDVVNMLNTLPAKSFKQPGLFYSYCNTNYVLLSMIVKQVTGLTLKQFTEKEIFDRAGMNYSQIRDAENKPLWKYAVQGFQSGRVVGEAPQNGTSGDKNVYSSTYEMFLLDRALRSPYLLHKDIQDEMYAPQAPTTSFGQYYALGWRITYKYGKKWAFHNGWWKGFRTYYWRCLDDDICYVVLTNLVGGSFLSTADMVDLLENPNFQDITKVYKPAPKKKYTKKKSKKKSVKKRK